MKITPKNLKSLYVVEIRINLRWNQKIEQVEEFTYLGSTGEKKGRSVIKQTFQAKVSFNQKKGLFTSRNISQRIRKNLLRKYVWSK